MAVHHRSGWWFFATPLKNDGGKVSWDDDIPNIWYIWKNKIHVPKHQPALSRYWLYIFVQQSQFLSWECSQLPKKATNDNWFNKPWINHHYIAGLPQGYLWNGFWIFVSAGPASDSVSQRFRQIISATTSSFQMVALMVTNQLRSLSHSVAELKAPFISIYVLCLMASCGCYIRPARRLRKRRVNKIEHFNFPKPWTFKSDTAPSMHWKPKHWMASLTNWSHCFFNKADNGVASNCLDCNTSWVTAGYQGHPQLYKLLSAILFSSIPHFDRDLIQHCEHFVKLMFWFILMYPIRHQLTDISTRRLICDVRWCRDSTVPYGEAL